MGGSTISATATSSKPINATRDERCGCCSDIRAPSQITLRAAKMAVGGSSRRQQSRGCRLGHRPASADRRARAPGPASRRRRATPHGSRPASRPPSRSTCASPRNAMRRCPCAIRWPTASAAAPWLSTTTPSSSGMAGLRSTVTTASPEASSTSSQDRSGPVGIRISPSMRRETSPHDQLALAILVLVGAGCHHDHAAFACPVLDRPQGLTAEPVGQVLHQHPDRGGALPARRRLLAARLWRYPSSWTAPVTRRASVSETPGSPFTTRETDLSETPGESGHVLHGGAVGRRLRRVLRVVSGWWRHGVSFGISDDNVVNKSV